MFIPGFLISIATFPGVVVHELAHVAFCKFTDTRVVQAVADSRARNEWVEIKR
jgi:hypothetical protein